MNQDKISNKIKELRKQNNLTQKEFASIFGVTYQAVSKWENGINIPDIEILKSICKKYDLDINEFLLGNLLPDMYSGWIIKNASKIEIYETSHIGKKTLLNGKKYTLPNIEKFEEENRDLFKNNILVLGYFVHILTDYFFNKYSFQNHYVKDENSITIGCYLKNGEFLSGDVESVKKYKHLDFLLFSNKKLKSLTINFSP